MRKESLQQLHRVHHLGCAVVRGLLVPALILQACFRECHHVPNGSGEMSSKVARPGGAGVSFRVGRDVKGVSGYE